MRSSVSSLLLQFCEIWGLTALLTILFALAGNWLYRLSFGRPDSEEDYLRWGLSTFLGMYLYLALFRLFGALIGARVACYLGLVVLLVAGGIHAAWEEGGLLRRARPWHIGAAFLTLFLAFTLLAFVLWLPPPPGPLFNFESHAGTAHSGRYSNIALYVNNSDDIPRVNQNYGQSLLAATHLFLGTNSPLASLVAWLSASQAARTLLLFGLFRGVLPTARDAIVGTFIVLFCNIALSSSHVFVIDSCTPLAFAGYTDTTSGYATWVGWILWLHRWNGASGGWTYRSLTIPALLAFAWNLCAPQNIVMGLLLCGAFFAIATLRREASRCGRLALLIGVFLAATLLGSALGGMLMPQRWSDPVDLPGLMTPYAQGPPRGVELDPGLPFVLDPFHKCLFWWQGGRTPTDAQLLADARTDGLLRTVREIIFRLESHLWDALRLLFFPILGIVGLAALLLHGRIPAGAERREYFRTWDLCAAISFLAGFGITFCLRFHGFKWELSRFLIPGVLTALVCLVFFAFEASRLLARGGARAMILLVLVVACTSAPIVEIVEVVVVFAVGRRTHLSVPDLRERIDLLFRTREILPKAAPEGAQDVGPAAVLRPAASRRLADRSGRPVLDGSPGAGPPSAVALVERNVPVSRMIEGEGGVR